MEYSTQGYINVVGFLFWPIVFSAIIGYVYLKNQSVTIVAVVILIVFAAFGNMFVGVDEWYSLMYILVALAVTGLLLVFLTKVRG